MSIGYCLGEGFFSSVQIKSLKRDLLVRDDDALIGIVELIFGACYYYKFVKNKRRKVPDLRAARENSSAILHHTKSLLKVINQAPLGVYYVCFEGHERLVDKKEADRIGSSEHLLLENLAPLLSGIISQAEILTRNEDRLRAMYMLPDAKNKNNILETLYLWPALLRIYQDARQNVAYSPDGPLVRYITTVHEALSIAAPSNSTIRTFVPAWKASLSAENADARQPC